MLGQARLYLALAGETEGKGRNEDEFAYQRDVMDYRNALLVEQPNDDFGSTMMRQLLFTCFLHNLHNEMLHSGNEQLKAISGKAIKETTYHLRHVSDWVIRLGDGTEESHKKVQDALDNLWMLTDDLFVSLPGDKQLEESKMIPSMSSIKSAWQSTLIPILEEATLKIPESSFMFKGGRKGIHSEHLGHILAELQFLPRAYPGAKW
jgi:ring-1,2-phenylacetyl-CoA epoxidase subunit PaaC